MWSKYGNAAKQPFNKKSPRTKGALTSLHLSCEANEEILSVESLQFNLGPIRNATDNFSDSNKLGQGGFGAVYKVIKCHHYIYKKIIISTQTIKFL